MIACVRVRVCILKVIRTDPHRKQQLLVLKKKKKFLLHYLIYLIYFFNFFLLFFFFKELISKRKTFMYSIFITCQIKLNEFPGSVWNDSNVSLGRLDLRPPLMAWRPSACGADQVFSSSSCQHARGSRWTQVRRVGWPIENADLTVRRLGRKIWRMLKSGISIKLVSTWKLVWVNVCVQAWWNPVDQQQELRQHHRLKQLHTGFWILLLFFKC